MKKYIIATESCADLPSDIVEGFKIQVIPMVFELEGKTYHHFYDAREMQTGAFYQRLRSKAVAKTSLVNVGEFLQFFEPLLKEGVDILHISFSSALSGTYQSALMAIEMLKETYPQQKIIAIDSLCASAGLGRLVWLAAKKRQEGMGIDALAEWIEANKLKLCHLFTVEDLGTLRRGGRLSGTAAFFGTLLGVKPVLHVSDEGKLEVVHKAVGRKNSLRDMVNIVKEKIVNPEEQTIFVSHGDCRAEAEEVGKMITSALKVKGIVYSDIGPMIGSHSGPGTIAVFFMGRKR